jgi:uncharacterized protein (DUF3084 family)
MKNCALLVAALAGLMLVAGCGEGPVFPEDRSLVTAAAEEDTPAEDVPAEKKDGGSLEDDFLQADPEEEKKIEEKKKKEEEEKKVEEEQEEAMQDARKFADILSEHIYKKNLDEAIKLFEQYKDAIETAAKEEMASTNDRVRQGYKMWKDGLFELYDFLKTSDLPLEEKAQKAQVKLNAASEAKRSAEFAKTFE